MTPKHRERCRLLVLLLLDRRSPDDIILRSGDLTEMLLFINGETAVILVAPRSHFRIINILVQRYC